MGKVVIVSGKQGGGKTTQCLKLAEEARKENRHIGGFLAIGEWKEGLRHSFKLLDLRTNDTYELASRENIEGWEKVGSFYFNPDTIKMGEKILREHVKDAEWLFVDEIGKFDIQGRVWGPVLKEILSQSEFTIIAVRENFVDDVLEYFNITDHLMFKYGNNE